MLPEHHQRLEELVGASRGQWALMKVNPDIHAGVSHFEGAELLQEKRDFEYWFPEAFRSSDKPG
jgi:hypothetical protein